MRVAGKTLRRAHTLSVGLLIIACSHHNDSQDTHTAHCARAQGSHNKQCSPALLDAIPKVNFESDILEPPRRPVPPDARTLPWRSWLPPRSSTSSLPNNEPLGELQTDGFYGCKWCKSNPNQPTKLHTHYTLTSSVAAGRKGRRCVELVATATAPYMYQVLEVDSLSKHRIPLLGVANASLAFLDLLLEITQECRIPN